LKLIAFAFLIITIPVRKNSPPTPYKYINGSQVCSNGGIIIILKRSLNWLQKEVHKYKAEIMSAACRNIKNKNPPSKVLSQKR
jgi:hypothetical protein